MKKMKKMKNMKKITVLLLCVCVLLGARGAESAEPSRMDNELLNHADQVLVHLKNRDFGQLALFVHKDKGVVFSPYAFVEENAVKFTAAQIKELELAEEFTWGVYDGSGEPIELSVEGYFNRFVFGQDFINAPQRGVNELVKTGNTSSNLDIVFPGAGFVEYHFPGFDPQYEGMDWVSLRLVFEKVDDMWMLVGVVHDCWTI